MGKIKIGFLGYGVRALDSLMEHPMFEVRYFFAPKARLCKEVYAAREKYKDCLAMEVIEDKKELAMRFGQISDVDCFLMNACPIILDSGALSKMEVFNIHPGDLRYNRGHQPQCWTVLLGEGQTKITLHKVGKDIDTGPVIKSVDIKVLPDDNAGDVLNHAEDKIPILLDALYRHLTEHTAYEAVVENGGYRRIMAYADYEIHLSIDTKEQIKRKILSRSMHHGAFFMYGEERIYVDGIVSYKEYKERQDSAITIWIEEEEGLVHIHSLWRSVVFKLNKIEEAK